MNPDDFKHYDLRVGLDLVLRYGGLGASVTRAIHRLAHDGEHHTVVHVHMNTPLDRDEVPGTDIFFYEMPGLVGLSDKTKGRNVLFNTLIAESYLTDCNGDSLRRLDIHYNQPEWKRNQEDQ